MALVGFPILSLNRAWSRRVWPDIHLAADIANAKEAPAPYEDMAERGLLWCVGSHWVPLEQKGAHRMKFREDGKLWSSDIEKGICTGFAGNGSVTYAAFQLAAWLGFTRMYVLGLDLGERRFDGSKASPDILKQNVLMGAAYSALRKKNIEVWNVGSPNTRCRDIPLMTFGEMLEREGTAAQEVKALEAPTMAAPQ